ncbi:signal peptidase II [Acinetobacter defluvii]|uniref:Lipoprotein signal peptidase n=1 Tax=Acinetobacter defluvii TaxID=1871111 RepID=A0A2S2FHJ6_9GAMM|nr:signal peptidase II [Acinetobacter defluvii]AWL30380.1 lipoprotein signal peptidase [Acinetobacter defluvii]NNP73984.1 signal peptidase II [Acinetobacter defluvii]
MPNPHNKKGLFQFYTHNLMWLGLSVLAIIIDQWTKHIASTHLTYADPVPVLPFLNWTLLHNYGAAFSFLSDAGGWQHYLFTGLAGIVSIIFIFWLLRMPKTVLILPMAIALILGGAIGNLIDRVSLGYVVDFIHVFYQNHHFPAFNIADSAITLGTILLLIDTFFLEKQRIQRVENAK